MIMKPSLQISCFQIPLDWNNPKTNRIRIESYIEKLSNTDVVVLPETFSTGFSVEDLYEEAMEGETVVWMLNMAKRYKVVIVGSIIISENKKRYNRMFFITPNGVIQQYDKWHLFGMGNESKFITKGEKLPIFEYKGWKIKPLICYDLRFPVTSRNTEEYDVILCIANWPKQRIEAWDTLLKARAIENLCYVIGVNRVGVDENGLQYIGHSNCFNPEGVAFFEIDERENILTTRIEKGVLYATRKKFPFLEDRDFFTLKI